MTYDIHIGQLALARGLVSLSELLRCTIDASNRNIGLSQVLIAKGHLEQGAVEELEDHLKTMSPTELDDAIEDGETIVLRTLLERSEGDSQTLVGELLDTLDGEPEIQSSPDVVSNKAGESSTHAILPQAGTTSDAEVRYEFLDELGRGGMGQVLRAHDRLLEREIALKTVLPDTSVKHPRDRLWAEAQLTGQLEHPSIVPVYELGQLSNGEPYYTMRVVPKRSLQTTLDELRDDAPDAPTLTHLVQIVRQVCLAVQFAHENGVIHRDLKPENILLGEYGEVFIIDWGIAKILSPSTNTPSPTSEVDQLGAVVGTPQYMAPEQAHGDNESVDERTDVYALGAILYEIMTLSPVFTSSTVLGLLVTIVQEDPVPPSRRAPDRKIPEALEEICLRALSKERRDRYPTVQALADELDLFIEGVKERERTLEQARDLISEAGRARDDYDEARRQLQAAIEDRDRHRDSIPAWADRQSRIPLWKAEDRVEKMRIEVERHFGQTIRLLSQSLSHTALDEAHDALATMYWDRFLEAERRSDHQMAVYFENLVRQHDTGAFTQRLKGLAALEVKSQVEETDLTLCRVKEYHRRLQPIETVTTSSSALVLERLSHGLYELRATAPGFAPVQMPLVLDRQETRQLRLQQWPRPEVPDDFAVIPAGPFSTGSTDDQGTRLHRIELQTYAIQKTQVTCQEYADFLNALAQTDLESARQHAPRPQEEASSYFPYVDGQFIVPDRDDDGDAWDPDWPIFMINYYDAKAYADWRSQRDGKSYRLPTSMEWEKAARGVDARLYPWGNHFDASFCRIRESAPGKPMPAPVATHPNDTSPYGVLDMAGNISEWTATEQTEARETYILRGGSYNSFPLMCRLDWHMHSPASYRLSHYGFRLVLDLEPPPTPSEAID